MSIKYFAYGSNMSLARLRERVPGAKRIGCFLLKKYRLCFHKISINDGSGKCDAFYTGSDSDCVFGVLFEIPLEQKKMLDKIEGLGYGYSEKMVSITSRSGQEELAATYYAITIDETLKPYSWYKDHLLLGAIESHLPRSYIKILASVKSVEDPNIQRDKEQRAIHNPR